MCVVFTSLLHHSRFLFLVSLLLKSSLCASDNEVFINDVSEFTTFYNNINNGGTNYNGTTVYLTNDLDLSSSPVSTPIGTGPSNCFKGTFDGQGHILKGLKMSSSSYSYLGLFGYSTGMTVRNVVIDSNSSFTNSIQATNTYTGGILGSCTSSYGPIIIENVVNMGSVSYTGTSTSSSTSYLGGIIGNIMNTGNKVVFIRNCANYGAVTYGGSSLAYVGGIAGHSHGGTSNAYIHNCFNYGHLSGASTTSYIGGIIGNGLYYTIIENCVSVGAISSKGIYIGSIAGSASSSINITHSFWTSDTGCNKVCGRDSSTSISNSSLITLNIATIIKLNDYAKTSSEANNVAWNKWLLNEDNKSVTFYISSTTSSITLKSQIILFPSTTTLTGYSFIWYTDSVKSNKFGLVSITDDTSLYGGIQLNSYTVTFDFENGTMINESFPYSTEIQYPENNSVVREGFTFDGWDPKPDLMPSNSFTTTAQWTKNIYTVTFDFGNGTMINESFPYNSEIQYPEEITIREGYIFNGWNPEPDLMPAHNFTTITNWTEIPKEEESSSSIIPALIKITFGSIDLNEEEIINIISNYTDAEFTIIKFETDNKSGELTVIIKFTDKEKAESFVEVINNSSTNDVIKNAMFITGNIKSFSHVFTPLLFFIISLII